MKSAKRIIKEALIEILAVVGSLMAVPFIIIIMVGAWFIDVMSIWRNKK